MKGSTQVASINAIPEIVRVTLRQLMGRRRTIWLLLLAALPVILALLFRAASQTEIEPFTRIVFDTIAITILMPLVAILFGSGAFGAEFDVVTIFYLFAKPVPRWMVVLAKAVAVITVSIALSGTSIALAGAIDLAPIGAEGLKAAEAQVLAIVVGSVCYASLFLALIHIYEP